MNKKPKIDELDEKERKRTWLELHAIYYPGHRSRPSDSRRIYWVPPL